MNYEELQKGAKNSNPNNMRKTSVLLLREEGKGGDKKEKGKSGWVWHHIHETWVPEKVLADASFDF